MSAERGTKDRASRRGPAAFPLALGASLFAVSVLTGIVVGAVTPASGLTPLESIGQWLGWFCGVGLLVALNVALAAWSVTRRGTPSRFALALVVAVLAFYAASFLLSLARGWLVHAWAAEQPDSAATIVAWMPFASLLQMLLVAALGLALAGRFGGPRLMAPDGWPLRSRRALGAVVALGGSLGLLPLQVRLIGMLDLVSLQALQLGLPFLAATLSIVHALAWGIAPARGGSGAGPAMASAALIGPLLLSLAWLSQFILPRIGPPAVVAVVASALLLACPVLAWAICRRAADHFSAATRAG